MSEPLVSQLIRHVVRYLGQGDVSGIASLDDTPRIWESRPPEAGSAEPIDLTDLLISFAAQLFVRYHDSRSPADLDVAVVAVEQCVRELPDDHPKLAPLLGVLVGLASDRYDRTGDLADLDSSISARERGLTVSADTDPGQPCDLSNLSTARRTRYERTEDPADLDAAVDLARAAVATTPSDHPHRPRHLRVLAHSLQLRFARTASDRDLGELLTAAQAVADHADHSAADLSYLGEVAAAVFRASNDATDLETAINARERWLIETSPDAPGRPDCLVWLQDAQRARYDRIRSPLHLTALIASCHSAVDGIPPDHPDRAQVFTNLCRAHLVHFHLTTDRADLNAAVDAARSAVDATPDNDYHRPCAIARLGEILLIRHNLVGSAPDLDEAVAALEESIKTSTADHPDRAHMLIVLVGVLKARYHYHRYRSDLDATIRVAEEATRVCPADDVSYPHVLENLSDARWVRYEHGGDPTDLAAAIEINQSITDRFPDLRERAALRSALCLMLHRRFQLTGDASDLEAALSVGVEAKAAPRGDRVLAQFLIGFGFVLKDKYERSGIPADFAAVVNTWRPVAESELEHGRERERAAREWGDFVAAQGNWSEAAIAYTTAVEVLTLLAWRGLDRGSQEHWLTRRYRSAGNAAACAISSGDRDQAIEVLEHGRSVLWSQLLDIHTDLTALVAARPEIAQQLLEIRAELDHTGPGRRH